MRGGIPNDYPRPQFFRKDWMSLDGEWQFELDLSNSGEERGMQEKTPLACAIRVPFCPESPLSGVGCRDFIPACWYRKDFALPPEWSGRRVLLHFGAVYYRCRVWINGSPAGEHMGGHASFALDITELLSAGENSLVVQAVSDVRDGLQPSGKQSQKYASYGCYYTRTTGIWQSVWLEAVAQSYVSSYRYEPDIANRRLNCRFEIVNPREDLTLTLRASYQGAPEGEVELRTCGPVAQCALPLEELHLWEAGKGRLYRLTLALCASGEVVDRVESYFGMREVCVRNGRFLLNGAPVFQRLVLDQGFNSQGVLTPPDDELRRMDILRAMRLGFNGARLHQKVFDARTLYWADRCGYMLWGEYPSWGLDTRRDEALVPFTQEWLEVMKRDISAPSIVGWCPLNETDAVSSMGLTKAIYRLTKAMDPARPVIDTSGWTHCGETDIFDYHDYTQDPAEFAAHVREYAAGVPGRPFAWIPGMYPYADAPGPEIICHGEGLAVSEFGGIGWTGADGDAWGYGAHPASEAEYLERLAALCRALNTAEGLCMSCYTQLTDVEQEQNGLYTYDRKIKFPEEALREGILAGVPEEDRPGAPEIFEL